MNQSFIYRLKNKIISLPMLLCIIVGYSLLMWFSVTNWFQYNRLIGEATFSQMCGDFINEVIVAHSQSGFALFAPIFAVVPCVTIFCDDYTSGYIKSILSRSSKRKYIRECINCCSITGGLAVFLPDFFCGLTFLTAADPHIQNEYNSSYALYSGIEYIWEGRLMLIIFLFFSFLFGVVWANIGLCISAYTPNRYVAMAAPFAICYGIHLICERIDILGVLSPLNMIQPTYGRFPGLIYPIVYQLVLLSGAIILFYQRINRRLLNV